MIMEMSRREANRLERRGAIIAVARKHFFGNGYDATSMSAIATELGGSKGTLWSYFPSKEELFAAVVDDTATQIRAQLDLDESGNEPFQQIFRLCRSFIDRGTSPMVQSMMRVIISEAHRRPEVGRIFFEHGPSGTQLLVAEYLEKNFADLMWTNDYFGAGKTLVALCMEGSFYQQLWGVSGEPTEAQRDADARKAALLFLRAFGNEELVRSLEERTEPGAKRKKAA